MFALASIIIVGIGFLFVPKLWDNLSINVVIPLLAVYFVSLVAGAFLMMRRFNSKIANI